MEDKRIEDAVDKLLGEAKTHDEGFYIIDTQSGDVVEGPFIARSEAEEAREGADEDEYQYLDIVYYNRQGQQLDAWSVGEEGEEDEEDEYDPDLEYQIGDDIEVHAGDKIFSRPYGEFWVVRTGVIGGLWTSNDKQDLRTGRGRGLRHSYVSAIQKDGRGPWYQVKLEDRNDEIFRVTGIGKSEDE